MTTSKSKYGVFIIESLRRGDFFDGENLSEILGLSDIENIYREVNTISDFKNAIVDFKESNFRYLHLSCHADMDGIEVNGKEITNINLSEIFKGNVNKKRIFLSACKGGNRNLATAAISESGAQSVIGTPIDLYFDKAALFWPAFYHVINCEDQKKMNQSSLSSTLKRCVDLFEIPINYYHSINGQSKFLRRYKFRDGKPIKNKKILRTKVL
ncbi:hypothetical protein BCT47_25640 [Vibrio splendidus]|uniref:hypothetical protein n=1 Tax=Vibrio splendidus TaxID=29497 RepID=UPI000C84CF56|nr:hypothetical protein [Vibrio splendidus]PMM71209.1 hypothetical protein BCT47_25640 [Vibrio splendidus]